MSDKKTVAVDLDGVLAQYDGWRGVLEIGEPIEGAVEFTRRLHEEGFKIVIHTTRCNPEVNTEFALRSLAGAVESYLDCYGFCYDEIFIGRGKPLAVAYIDDRAVSCKPQVDNDAFRTALNEMRQPF